MNTLHRLYKFLNGNKFFSTFLFLVVFFDFNFISLAVAQNFNNVEKLYFNEKLNCYKSMYCHSNTTKVLNKILQVYPEVENEILIVNMSNLGDGDWPVGYKNYGYHVFLIIWNDHFQSWNVLDYDASGILGEDADHFIEASSYLQKIFHREKIKTIFSSFFNNKDNRLIKGFPQFKIFKPEEWKSFSQGSFTDYENSLKYGIYSTVFDRDSFSGQPQKWEKIVPLQNILEFIEFISSQEKNILHSRIPLENCNLDPLLRSQKNMLSNCRLCQNEHKIIKIFQFLFPEEN